MSEKQRYQSLLMSGLCLLLLCTHCSEVIDLKVNEQEQNIVIYGKVTDGTAGNELSISLTSEAGAEQEPIEGAQAVLLENNIPIGIYEPYEPGKYRLNLRGDSARAGQQYELSITLPDGRQFKSLPAIMPELAAIDKPRFDASVVDVTVNQAGLLVERNLIQLWVDTEIVDQENDFYLKWDIFETYSFQERFRVTNPPEPIPSCYITNVTTGQEIYLFNGAEIKVPEIRDQLLSTSEIDSRFAFDYYFSVVQTTMDKQAFEYWTLVNEVSNSRGSIFDQPPAPVGGNFRNEEDPDELVLGYFEVVRSDTTRARVRGDAIPFFVSIPCPGLAPGVIEPAACTDCLLIKNSTFNRPYFWF